MKRYWVPAIPFALSLCLSACTIGTTVYWQDSGFFLTGVKELGVLYPPGFVFYLIVCKAWTLIFGFLDFTLAVHLFSSLCAALAAATLAVASRDLLRTKGSLFGVSAGEGEIPAIAAGCLAAAGYTFWSAALLAKGYALLYLVLSAVIWRMIRADETGKGRDFTIVAALIGFAWAVHPSATNAGLAFVLFVAAHRKAMGWKGIAARTGLAAACAVGPSLLLPLLAAREPNTMFGHPSSVAEWLRYLRGGRFTDLHGVFGLEAFRAVNTMKYFWEDFLGAGLVFASIGLLKVARSNPRLLAGIAAWVVPSALVATLFKIEGQQDLWLVAAWLPLHLAVAVGLQSIPARRARVAIVSVGIVGVAWAVVANGAGVSMRGYTLAESFGRFHLEPLEPGALLLLDSDDALSTTQYLQLLKDCRRDVRIVNASRFEGSGWYARHLARLDSSLRPADSAVAFANANVSRSRPVYFETPPPETLLKPDYLLVPAGPFMKMAPRDEPAEPAAWDFPVTMEEVRARSGRERGIRLEILPDRLIVTPEAYERRWIHAFVRTRSQQAQVYFKRGGVENYRRAAELFETARAADPDSAPLALLHPLAASLVLTGQYDRAEPLLKRVLLMSPPPRIWVKACYYLSKICQSQGRKAEEARYREQAMSGVGSDPELRREFEQFSKPR